MSEEGSVLGKRGRDGETETVKPETESSDDDVGPMPLPALAETKLKKKRKGVLNFATLGCPPQIIQNFLVLPHERLYLEHLPDANQYYKSFMHREIINFCVVTRTEFLITTSVDGHIKLWRKEDDGIEFVKHYRAHLQPVVGISASADGQLFASISEDGTAKVFDVVNFGQSSCLRSGLTTQMFLRYDQYYKIGLYAPLLLLDSQKRPSPGSASYVRCLCCDQ